MERSLEQERDRGVHRVALMQQQPAVDALIVCFTGSGIKALCVVESNASASMQGIYLFLLREL
jgi:hypothetical protein